MIQLIIQPYTDTNDYVLCLTNEYDPNGKKPDSIIESDDVAIKDLSVYLEKWMTKLKNYKTTHKGEYKK